MTEAKGFYRTYLADDNTGTLNGKLAELIRLEHPQSVFEFGCGTGKNLRMLGPSIVTCGLDVSPMNIIVANTRNDRPFVIIGDETHLGHLHSFDVAFTCSVLDHIELISKVVADLKNLAKIVYLAETNDVPGQYYYPHSYEEFGFTKIKDFEWTGDDGAKYYIWRWSRHPKDSAHDDLGR
jgi:SAM-dependent methyltransferase